MDEEVAVEALERLGLSNYEARVFVALQPLGVGTALEVHRVSDVPRSQVYGTAERLQERGLVEIEESSPKRYRPVSLDAARAQLAGRLAREEARAFDALETLQRAPPADEGREAVATLRGREPVRERVEALLDRATDRILVGTGDPALVSAGIADRLLARAADGVAVTIVSENASVRDRFERGGISVHAPPTSPPDGFTGRLVLVDDDSVLVSVGPDNGDPAGGNELALWTADTAIARILARFLWTGVQAVIERDEPPPG